MEKCSVSDEEKKVPTVVLGLSADQLAGLAAGVVVLIIVLVTFSLLLCICVTLWRRRKAAGKPGTYTRNCAYPV